ncbi:MAG: hypothetical protein US89_C0003G0004 [Candidatus Peregrinibacteria bacterium GW2011_GWF2_38_29]|nr:MAG: hypothetical protein US89_C0003G0004 [Candidatus Peregrinibacteria bacterium GW2011_GWF2_38_29]HBB02886.1 hypothetical protein [Candidatus Peregrinibacteria bacterium]
MDTYTPEQVLALSDEEIIRDIERNDDFAAYLRELQLEIYGDDTLGEVKTALTGEAINRASVDCNWRKEWTEDDRKQHREELYPLAFKGDEAIDIRVRTLARVRCAIKRIADSVSDLAHRSDERTKLQNLLKRTKDGDLTVRYADSDRDGGLHLAGEDSREVMFGWGLNFSPDLQLKLASDYEIMPYDPIMPDKGAEIIGILAQECQLSPVAWKVLLDRDNDSTYRAIWNTKDTRLEVMDIIMRSDKFALLYRARTEKSARADLLKRASEFHDANFKTWFRHRPIR